MMESEGRPRRSRIGRDLATLVARLRKAGELMICSHAMRAPTSTRSATLRAKSIMRRILLALAFTPLATHTVSAQEKTRFSHADSLRGMNSPQRSWWDVSFYDLHVSVNPADSTIRGHNAITYRVLRPANEMQIDLQAPLVADSMVQDGQSLTFRRDSNSFFVTLPSASAKASSKTIDVFYHGK